MFFLLVEDYIQAQKTFMKDLDLELERLARSLKDSGAVVKPFLGDIEQTRQSVLDKSWTEEQKKEIMKTPGLLMIEEDFNAFDPREHRWILFHLADRDGHEPPSANDVARYRAIFDKIAQACQQADLDPFEEARRALSQDTIRHASQIVELKPGIFGISVDIRAAGQRLIQWFRDRKNSVTKGPDDSALMK